MIDPLMINFSALLSIIMLVSQVLKCKFNIKEAYIPMINLILGCLFNWMITGQLDIWQGIVIGMSASGFYDICTKSFKKEKDKEWKYYE